MFVKASNYPKIPRNRLWALGIVAGWLPAGLLAATVDIQVRSNFFDADTVNINVGDTVRWTAVDSGHTVTSGSACGRPDGIFDSGTQTLPAGATFSQTFTQPGTFPYFCRPHCSIGMTGVVKVAGAPPVARNRPPILKLTLSNNSPNKRSRKIDEGETETIKAVASDPNGDPVTLEVSSLPPGAVWNPVNGRRATGQFSWTPVAGTAAAQSVVTLVFSATDNPTNGAVPLTTKQAVTLTVGQNSPPELADIQAPPAIVGKPITLTVKAIDSDRDKLKFLPTQGLPDGAKFRTKPSRPGAIAGIFKWLPRADQVGQEFRITFTVQDNFLHPFQDSEDLEFTVMPR